MIFWFSPFGLGITIACLTVIVVGVAAQKRAFAKKLRKIRRVKFVEREHPVFGRYREREDGRWSSDIASHRLGYELTLLGEGLAPTEGQLDRWREMEERLPNILAEIPRPPDDDGWGNSLPDFSSAAVKAKWAHIKRDLSFEVGVHVPIALPLHVSPIVEVAPDWTIVSAEWVT